MNVNMLSPSLSKNTFHNRTTCDKENGQMNRAIQNHRITGLEATLCAIGVQFLFKRKPACALARIESLFYSRVNPSHKAQHVTGTL